MGEWRVGRSKGILFIAELRQELMRKERFESAVKWQETGSYRHSIAKASIFQNRSWVNAIILQLV